MTCLSVRSVWRLIVLYGIGHEPHPGTGRYVSRIGANHPTSITVKLHAPAILDFISSGIARLDRRMDLAIGMRDKVADRKVVSRDSFFLENFSVTEFRLLRPRYLLSTETKRAASRSVSKIALFRR